MDDYVQAYDDATQADLKMIETLEAMIIAGNLTLASKITRQMMSWRVIIDEIGRAGSVPGTS